ncbi:putative hydrolases of HD superfamily [Marinococcus luteus]|uniref:Putative hydrolases of HD superfamily n=1 Tax=Marinococcus luteus TaxID=1122204 RepID=A0A1H2UMT8_9BACI|nr:HD domain-containing protein [Marinococcus luteus]SDW57377.1 putative hydrolases of HD superfamily [Marinococcus luteus]
MNARLFSILETLELFDEMKSIQRASLKKDGDRENDAEHSWHLCMYALLLYREVDPGMDIAKVVEMLLIHDLVEIYAGDTFAYNEEGKKDQEEREWQAAEKIKSRLPAELGRWYIKRWREFEKEKSTEADFARSLDRMQAMGQNIFTRGASWRKNGVRPEDVENRAQTWKNSSTAAEEIFAHWWKEALNEGYFTNGN